MNKNLKLIAVVALVAVTACSKGNTPSAAKKVNKDTAGLTDGKDEGTQLPGLVVMNDNKDTGLRVVVENIDLTASRNAVAKAAGDKAAADKAAELAPGKTLDEAIKDATVKTEADKAAAAAVAKSTAATKNSRGLRLQIQKDGKAVSDAGELSLGINGTNLDGTAIEQEKLTALNAALKNSVKAARYSLISDGVDISTPIAGTYDAVVNLIDGDMKVIANIVTKDQAGKEVVVGSVVVLSEKIGAPAAAPAPAKK